MKTFSIFDAIDRVWTIGDDLRALGRQALALGLAPVLNAVYPPVGETRLCEGCIREDCPGVCPYMPGDGAEELAAREAECETWSPLTDEVRGNIAEKLAGVPIPNGPPYIIDRDIKIGEKYCALCGVQLSGEYHACPVLASQRERREHLGPYLDTAGMFDGRDCTCLAGTAKNPPCPIHNVPVVPRSGDGAATETAASEEAVSANPPAPASSRSDYIVTKIRIESDTAVEEFVSARGWFLGLSGEGTAAFYPNK